MTGVQTCALPICGGVVAGLRRTAAGETFAVVWDATNKVTNLANPTGFFVKYEALSPPQRFDTYLRDYGTLVSPPTLSYRAYRNGQTQRKDTLLGLSVEATYRPLAWLEAGVSYSLLDDLTDFGFVDGAGTRTDAAFVNAIKAWFLNTGQGPQLGLFGDHWQKIYGEGCGLVEHAALEVIDKNANFGTANMLDIF